MKLLYVPIFVGLVTLTAEAMQQPQGDGGGRGWGRHHGGGGKGWGGHHGGGGGHCRRGDAQGCGNVSLTAKFDAGSVSPDVLKLESDIFRPVQHVQENSEIALERRWRSPITPGMLVTYRILKYAAGGQKLGTFIEADCGNIAPDFVGGRIHMTFSKKEDGWYNCLLSYPK